MPTYPFRPKSTTHLAPGQFWAIPLSAGGFACGRVLAHLSSGGEVDRRLFLAGLMDWSGPSLPTARSLRNSRVLAFAAAHIKAILENGGTILGISPLEGPFAEPTEMTDEISTWGYGVIRVLSEKHFSRALTNRSTRTRGQRPSAG